MPDVAPTSPPADVPTAPRLPSAPQAYAALSGLAVGALVVAVLFALIGLVGAASASSNKTSFDAPWLLAFPPLVVVLAFVARRRIRAAEGTVTGEKYANAAWYVAVVGGMAYVAYLAAIDSALRSEARGEFTRWADSVKAADPANPRDPALYAAFFEMIPVGNRLPIKTPENVAGIDQAFAEQLLAFRSSDLVRVVARNPGGAELRYNTMLRREQPRPGTTECALSATLVTPEGEHLCEVPMRADTDPEKRRRWQVLPPQRQGGGFVVGRRLTPYGWSVEALEYSAQQAAGEMMSALQRPGYAGFAYAGYVDPESDPKQGAALFEALVRTDAPRRALVGGAMFALPAKPGADAYLFGQVFGKAGGAAPTPLETARFRETWATPGRLAPAGSVLKTNPETLPVLTAAGDRLECSVPAEIVLTQEGPAGSVARARVVLRMPPDAERATLAELARLRGEGGTLAEKPPAGLLAQANGTRWRVTRIVSDLKPIPVRPPGGPGGGPPGM